MSDKKTFPPIEEFVQRANYKSSTENPDHLSFWEKEAQRLHWFKKWDKVLDGKVPFVRWFTGGKLNVSYNCIDRHLVSWKKNKAALIFEGEPGDERVMTYQDLYREVCKFANVLKDLNVKKGDIVTIYMPVIPEAIVAMLACTRIGAVHSVVFGGFAPHALAERVNDSKSKILVTADGYWRRGQVIRTKDNVDKALEDCPTVENVIVAKRVSNQIKMTRGRDHWYSELMDFQMGDCEPEQMDSEDTLFIKYTSGATGKPKGIVHTTGGYLTCASSTHYNVFDIKDEDVYWCAGDIEWITGHSYTVYGPLSNGSTVVIYEGAPDFPEKDRVWSIIEKYRVNIFYTSPTAIRMFMKWGDRWIANKDINSLRLLGSVGETLNPEVGEWYYKNVGKSRCPVVDTWWQTETGCIMISPLPGTTPVKFGSVGFPLPGIEADIVDDEGNSVPNGRNGYLVINDPWPAMARNVYKDTQKYIDTYWSVFENKFYTGDGAFKDEDGYFWISGRVDDVINVGGYRLGSAELESAVLTHPSVAEAAAIGMNDDVGGSAICIFVTLIEGSNPHEDLEKRISDLVVDEIGKFARPERIYFTKNLPKTRGGKIMRRLLRDVAEGRELGDTTTLLDVTVIDDLTSSGVRM
ncbi:acetate--CoA ligase [Alkalibacter mobilis]|uniref:acetate--CoA ligase n=1 Tax=Alkalibacter mobilis TaxID=2787712 RepID=UPI00189E3506|nr:acetate--CoA ligase [Alkalibacter mobilis]MBF7096267.1 acetate--CoA ligase [Alkalibacter mobilis]